MNFKGAKFSKSRGGTVDVPYFLSRYDPDALRFYEADRELLTKVEGGFETVGELYATCKFRAALGEALALAREANGHTFATLPSALLGTGSAGLDRKAPWFQIKEDKAAAATTVYVILRAIDNLKTILAPTLCVPHTAQKLHEYLGYDGQLFGTQHVVEYRRRRAATAH